MKWDDSRDELPQYHSIFQETNRVGYSASWRKLYSYAGTILFIKKGANDYDYCFDLIKKTVGAKVTGLRLDGTEYKS